MHTAQKLAHHAWISQSSSIYSLSSTHSLVQIGNYKMNFACNQIHVLLETLTGQRCSTKSCQKYGERWWVTRPTERWGKQGILPRAPQTFKAFFHDSTIMGCIFTLFPFLSHCLDLMSERLGRIISNAFTVCVDKLFDACKHVEPTPLINHPYMNN